MSYACLYMLSFWSKFTNCHLDLLWSLLSVSGAGGLLPFLPSGRWPSSTALRAGSTLGTFASSYALISLLTTKKKKHSLTGMFCLLWYACVLRLISTSLWLQSYCSVRRFQRTEPFISMCKYTHFFLDPVCYDTVQKKLVTYSTILFK